MKKSGKYVPLYKVNKKFDFGGQLKASLPGDLTALAGAASEFIAPGNPAGIGMIASGAGSAINSVNKYNDQQAAVKQAQTQQPMNPNYMLAGGTYLNDERGQNRFKVVRGEEQTPNYTRYANGGVVPRGQSNSEVEGGELARFPGGGTTNFEGASHEQGGLPTNLPNGTQIFSDRLKPNGSKKTFADEAKKVSTEKYQKIMDNDKSTALAKKTAELMFKKNNQQLSQLFNQQESQKDENLAGDLFAFGGQMMYKDGGIHIKESHRGLFTKAAKAAGSSVQEYASKILAHKENYSSTLVKRANFAHNASKWKHADGGEINSKDSIPQTNQNQLIVPPGHNVDMVYHRVNPDGQISYFQGTRAGTSVSDSNIKYTSIDKNKYDSYPKYQQAPLPITGHANGGQIDANKLPVFFKEGGEYLVCPPDFKANNRAQGYPFANGGSINDGEMTDTRPRYANGGTQAALDYMMNKRIGLRNFANGGQVPKYALGDTFGSSDLNFGRQGNSASSPDDPNNINYTDPNSNDQTANIIGQGTTAALNSIAPAMYLAQQGRKYDTQPMHNYNPQTLDSSSAIRSVNNSTAAGRSMIPGASSGSGSSAISGIIANNTQGNQNKQQVISEYENANAGIKNQGQQYNIGNQFRVDDINAANKGKALSNYYGAIGQIGRNAATANTQGMNNASAQQSDQMKMKTLDDLYSNYKYDKNTGSWVPRNRITQ